MGDPGRYDILWFFFGRPRKKLGVAGPQRVQGALQPEPVGQIEIERLGGERLVELIVESTHTCYIGDRVHRHAWGYGCGTCPACELRAAGWRAFRAGAAAAAGSPGSRPIH